MVELENLSKPAGDDAGAVRPDASEKSAMAVVRDALLGLSRDTDLLFEQNEDILRTRPAPERWTPLEILEHVSRTNFYLLRSARKGARTALKRKARGEVVPAGESDLLRLDAAADADFQWEMPTLHRPRGNLAPGRIRARLRAQWNSARALLEQLPEGEGRLFTQKMSVAGLGKIDLYQWLYFMALHAERHFRLMRRG